MTRTRAYLAELSSSCRTASRIGTIMAADAVLLIHMDKRPVGIMKPSMRSLGDVPVMRIALRAIRRCKLLCSTAIAIIKPEMKG